MISGIGIDLIETERVGDKIAKETGFREYIFSAAEITFCESKANKTEHYAARFAGKEAFLKAMGTGLGGGFTLNEIEILPDSAGKPELYFMGSTAEAIEEKGKFKFHITLTHLKNIACAMVVIEKL
jgi:holo-[acyl-carrier protein] synthase